MLSARPGFGLLGVVLALVAVAVIAALAVMPNLAQARDQWRVERSLDRLIRLTDGPTAMLRFNGDLGNYPGAIQQLSRPITNLDRNLCGGTYSGDQVGDWGGRYASRMYPGTGTPLPIGLMRDTLEWVAPDLIVVITGVDEALARQLDRKVDGAMDGTTGRVRYGAADADGLLTVRWHTNTGSC